MNDTPRTEALLIKLGCPKSTTQFAEFARQLERELADAVKAEREACANICDLRAANLSFVREEYSAEDEAAACAAAIRARTKE